MMTYSVKHSAKDVQSALEYNEGNTRSLLQTLISVNANPMDNRHDPRQSKADEHHGAIRSPSW